MTPNAMPEDTVLLVDQLSGGQTSLLFAAPHRVIVATETKGVSQAFEIAERALADGHWIAGYCAYEAGFAFEQRLEHLLPARSGAPLVWFGVYDAPHRMDAESARALVGDWAGEQQPDIGALAPDLTFDAYRERFDTVADYITAGDCYQVNLTFGVNFKLSGAPEALFRDLLLKQQTTYGALIRGQDQAVLSASPELFVRRAGNRLFARPMKGTAPRGVTPEDDARAKAALARDEKNRAENLMIVDLLRNDLGRIARIGTVSVSDLFTVETYPTLHTMTSGIEAEALPHTGLKDVFRNLFPCGSVTGAPKIRAMEIIAETETRPRGVYTGAIGFAAPDGDFAFNVAIRTAAIDRDGQGHMGIGGGVVADSDVRSEYDEALLKMRFLAEPLAPFGLIETLLWEKDKGFALLARHLERLSRSARHFGFRLEKGAARDALESAADGFGENRMRVRLLLERNALSVTAAPLPVSAGETRFRFSIAKERVETTNPFLYHKTTRRDFYDEPRKRAQAEKGVDEVVFLNERGELTEGSFTNLFVERDGVLLTPPIASGLLAGTLRADLIASGRAREAVLTEADLAASDHVYLGNSVRGLVKAMLFDETGST